MISESYDVRKDKRLGILWKPRWTTPILVPVNSSTFECLEQSQYPSCKNTDGIQKKVSLSLHGNIQSDAIWQQFLLNT